MEFNFGVLQRPPDLSFLTSASSQLDTFQSNHLSFIHFRNFRARRLDLMSTPASQLMLRHTRFFARKTTIRHASTTSEATQAASNTVAKSKEIASNVTSKASAGLTRVQSSAGPVLNRIAQSVNRTVSSIGGRTGRLINFGTCECVCFIYLEGSFCGQLVFKRRFS